MTIRLNGSAHIHENLSKFYEYFCLKLEYDIFVFYVKYFLVRIKKKVNRKNRVFTFELRVKIFRFIYKVGK